MTLILSIFAAGLAAELLVHSGTIGWKLRKLLNIVASLLTAWACVAIIVLQPNTASVLIGVAGGYRIFNAIRINKGRMHERYLRRTTRVTSSMLASFQLILLLGWWRWDQMAMHRRELWLILSVLQMISAGLLLLSTIRSLRRTQAVIPDEHFSDVQLPSITIAVPARNETQDLQECLASIIASDYPKFEVLVLDDCSQNKRTPEIIRGFAHDGVRFLRGDEPRETWLAKNQAYDQLSQEASGDYVLFCGADIRFEPDSIRKIMTMMLSRHKEMMSIMPLRDDGAVAKFSLLQAMRYWWELVPPRRLFNRPPVISSAWVISSRALRATGGFAAVTRAIVPESYFARQLIKPDAYSFMRSDATLGVYSVKTADDQRGTALRTRYPQLHRRPELVFFVSLLEIAFLALPFVLAFAGSWLPISGITQIFAIIATGLLVVSYELMASATRINHWLFALIALPFVVIADIAWLHRSMYKYEFSEVEWKGRNVCIPVMHTFPHLPKS